MNRDGKKKRMRGEGNMMRALGASDFLEKRNFQISFRYARILKKEKSKVLYFV